MMSTTSGETHKYTEIHLVLVTVRKDEKKVNTHMTILSIMRPLTTLSKYQNNKTYELVFFKNTIQMRGKNKI